MSDEILSSAQHSPSNPTEQPRDSAFAAPPLVFFAAMFPIRSNFVLSFLNFAATLALLTLLAAYYSQGSLPSLGLLGYPFLPLGTLGHAAARPPKLISGSVDLKSVTARTERNVEPLLRGVLLAIPVLFSFPLLLASADLVFAEQVREFLSIEILADILERRRRLALLLRAGRV